MHSAIGERSDEVEKEDGLRRLNDPGGGVPT